MSPFCCVFQFSMPPSKFSCFSVLTHAFHELDDTHRNAMQEPPRLRLSRSMLCRGAPSGADGALLLTFSSTAVHGVLSGTSIVWKGHQSTLSCIAHAPVQYWSYAFKKPNGNSELKNRERERLTHTHTTATSENKLDRNRNTVIHLTKHSHKTLSHRHFLHRNSHHITFLDQVSPITRIEIKTRTFAVHCSLLPPSSSPCLPPPLFSISLSFFPGSSPPLP